MISPTDDQRQALREIHAANKPGNRHLLVGSAGTGKTTLMQDVVREFQAMGLSVALTAPTHKAVAVLADKTKKAGLDVGCMTIHSLLSLYPKQAGERQVFVRRKHAAAVTADVVVIDECSMLTAELMAFIRRHLSMCFVLFVGDPAQLPPVGEKASQSFDIKSRSTLSTIVRQGADNPVLDAAHIIRRSQGGPMEWSWMKQNKKPPLGVYTPGDRIDAWLKKAFTSKDFDENPDRFRYMAWTNERVAQINAKIRRWRYGDNIPTPFVVGERALLRSAVVIDDCILLNNNEEAVVRAIRKDQYICKLHRSLKADEWVASVNSWRVTLQRDNEEAQIDVHIPRDADTYDRVVRKITDEALSGDPDRWKSLQEFKSGMARLQSIYALTVHCSQGSTFTNAFVDVPNIRRLASENPLEAQQMFYVAATRPTDALVLAGV